MDWFLADNNCPFCGAQAMFKQVLTTNAVHCVNLDCGATIIGNDALDRWNKRVCTPTVDVRQQAIKDAYLGQRGA